MKKTIWLMVILFVMAGGIYTYIFFSNRQVSNANTVKTSCCQEAANIPVQGYNTNQSCNINPATCVTPCPSMTIVAPSDKTNNSANSQSTITPNQAPCDNCVCGTDEECPNEDKCDACLEEEQQKQQGQGNRFGNGNGNRNQGQNRNGRK